MYQPITRIFDGKTFYQIPGFVDYWISADDEVISDKGRTHYLKVHFGYHGYYRVHLQHDDAGLDEMWQNRRFLGKGNWLRGLTEGMGRRDIGASPGQSFLQ